MEKIILANGTGYEIETGAALDRIRIRATDFEEVKSIIDTFTKDNLKNVSFVSNENITGTYHDLMPDKFSYESGSTLEIEGASDITTYVVTVSLREETDIEKRLDVLEEGQAVLQEGHEINAGAIEELADVLAGGEENG